MKKRELIREISIRLKKGEIIKIIKILIAVLKENRKITIIVIEVWGYDPHPPRING
jgi:hypothetical protein